MFNFYSLIPVSKLKNIFGPSLHQKKKQEDLSKTLTHWNNPNLTDNELLNELQSIQFALDGGVSRCLMPKLLKNKEASWFNRQCPESAALAIVAFTIRLFGNSHIIDKNTLKINKQKFEIAIHLIFGKNILPIKNDLFALLSQLSIKDALQDHYRINSNNYQINIIKGNVADIDKFVNSAYADQSFFQGQTEKSVFSFFGGEENCPPFIKEITAKNHKKKPKKDANTINALASKMKKDGIMYENTTHNSNKKYTVKAHFLIDSKPSLFSKIKPTELHKIQTHIPDLPLNAWKVEITKENNNLNAKKEKIHFTLTGAQHCKDENTNIQAAEQILKTILNKPPAHYLERNISYIKTKSIIDLRFLTGISKKIVSGNEQIVYDRHIKAMQVAVNKINEQEISISIGYFPIHCEAHSHINVAFAKIFTFNQIQTSTFSSPQDMSQLKNKMYELFNNISDKDIKIKYLPVLKLWRELLPNLHQERNAIPFATFTTILADVMNKHLPNDSVEILMGCKSAKDRTTAIVAGVNLLLPLIMDRLADSTKDISKLFDEKGYINQHNLSPNEINLIKSLYDLRLLHAANKFNTGVESNVSSDILIDSTFKNIDFIHHSKPFTINIPS